jgi:hypothetical protein
MVLEALDRVPLQAGREEWVVRRGTERRRRSRGWSVAVAGATLIWAIWGAAHLADRSLAPAAQPRTVELVSGFELGVSGAPQVIDGIEVYLGLAGPEPAFDTGTLGPAQPLSPSPVVVWENIDPPGPAVHLGDLGGNSIALFKADRPTHSCLIFGRRTERRGVGFCLNGAAMTGVHRGSAARPAVGDYVTWIGLPEEASVVVYTVDGASVFWQRPVSGVVFFDAPDDPRLEGRAEVIALDVHGNEITRLPVAP